MENQITYKISLVQFYLWMSNIVLITNLQAIKELNCFSSFVIIGFDFELEENECVEFCEEYQTLYLWNMILKFKFFWQVHYSLTLFYFYKKQKLENKWKQIIWRHLWRINIYNFQNFIYLEIFHIIS